MYAGGTGTTRCSMDFTMCTFHYRALTVALFIFVLACHIEANEETCSAASGSPSCQQSASNDDSQEISIDNDVFFDLGQFTREPELQGDLIMQELQALETFIRLGEERINILEELQVAIESRSNLSSQTLRAQALSDEVPMLSEVVSDKNTAPIAAAEDYLVSKSIIRQDEVLGFIKFLPLRSSAYSITTVEGIQVAWPPALLVAAQVDSTVHVFTMSGELLLTFSAGHEQPIMHLAVSPAWEQYLIATGDAGGTIRVHKINVQARRFTKDRKRTKGQKRAHQDSMDKISQYLGPPIEVMAQLMRQVQLPYEDDEDPPRLTALAMVSHHGAKYLVAGDAEGKVSVFAKNGTFRGKIDTTSTPGVSIDGLSVHHHHVLFRAGTEWGYINLENMEVSHVECPELEGFVTAAVIDSQHASRVLVADENGTVWAFRIRSKRYCKVEQRFAGTMHAPIDLASIHGFGLGLERAKKLGDPAAVLALNMTYDSKNSKHNPSAVVWRKSRAPVRAWAVHTRDQQADFLAFLSEDGKEIEIMELLMRINPHPKESFFDGVQIAIIVGVVGVIFVGLGYLYMMRKRKNDSPNKNSESSTQNPDMNQKDQRKK